MELAEVTELVEVAFVPRRSVSPSRADLVAALTAIGRVRAALDALEVEAVQLLADQGAQPEVVLADAARIGLREAGRVVERATTVAAVPVLGASLAAARVSGAHVDAFGRVLRSLEPAERAALVERAAFLTGVAERATPADFTKTLKAEAARVAPSDGEERLARQRRATSLRTWVDSSSGLWSGHFQFDPATGLLLDARIQAVVAGLFAEKLPDTCPSDPVARQAHLRALALAELILGGEPGQGLRRPTVADVALVIDLDHVDDAGAPSPRVDVGLPVDLPLGTIRHLCANAVINPVLVRNGVVVGGVGRMDLGRTSRLANRAQRRALRVMYPTCAIPGCDAPYSCTKPHHVIWWRHGGVTDLDNLLPLCSRHHHDVHDGGWLLKLRPDRTLTVRLPDGTTMHTGPPRNRGG